MNGKTKAPEQVMEEWRKLLVEEWTSGGKTIMLYLSINVARSAHFIKYMNRYKLFYKLI